MKKIVVTGEIYKDKFIDINSYVIDYKGKCFIVDPGYEKEKIQKFIEENNLEVLGILLTHSHLDHMSALDVYNVPIYLSSNEYPLFKNHYENMYNERGLKRNYSLEGREIIPLNEGDSIPFVDKKIDVFFTPGHTIGGVCYKFENDLFTGDTLFKNSVGRTDFNTGNVHDMRKSILYLLNNLDPNLNVHPGHMDSTTIGEEIKYNPYYQAWK
ncbi:MAG: MBL fold metallo-hydrolase [Clostridium sp.]